MTKGSAMMRPCARCCRSCSCLWALPLRRPNPGPPCPCPRARRCSRTWPTSRAATSARSSTCTSRRPAPAGPSSCRSTAGRSGGQQGRRAVPLGGRFVARGYAVATINYRLSQHAVFPAQIEDCKAAVRWLRANAARYGFDPARVASYGGSAGGHLVAMLGTTGDVKAFDVGEHLDHSSRVQAVVDYFGPTDFLQMDEHRLTAGDGARHARLARVAAGRRPDPRQPGQGGARQPDHVRHEGRPAVPHRPRRRRPARAPTTRACCSRPRSRRRASRCAS